MLYKKYPNLLKYLSLTFVGTSAGWVYYQIKRTQNILETAVDTSILKVKGAAIQQEENHVEEFVEVEHFYPYEKSGIFRNTWDALKFSFARRLVRLANNDNKKFRMKAVKQLAHVKNLDKWHCALLANMIDPRTAVGLARSGEADNRLFLEPPLRYHNYNRDMIINAMREFLIMLFEKSQHPCMGYFLSKAFVYEHDNSHIVDHDSSSLELSKFIQSESDVLPKCLESLLHHSTIQKHAKDIVDLNGLPLLMEIHNRYENNIDITIKLCQIISYMSYDRSLLQPMHKSGWIGILSEWLNHDDIRVSVPAARALANLDVDNDVMFSRHIYVLHPTTRTAKDHELDVVFIHGLLGGVFYTWRQRNNGLNTLNIIGKKKGKENIHPDDGVGKHIKKPNKGFFRALRDKIEHVELYREFEIVCDDIPTKTNDNAEGPYTCQSKTYSEETYEYTHCWPKDWLSEDCQNLRIMGINYDTSLSMWAPICPAGKVKFTLDERSEDLLEELIATGLGSKPIVWITHSMGGLIVKNILCNAFKSEDPRVKKVCENTKGIVFYSTPHNGSRLANLSQATALLLWPSVEVQELRQNSPQLKNMHQRFLEIVESVPMKIITFVETKATVVTAMKFNFLLVEPESGDPGVGEYFEVPQDHLGICKPITKYSFLYQKVLSMLTSILNDLESPNKT